MEFKPSGGAKVMNHIAFEYAFRRASNKAIACAQFSYTAGILLSFKKKGMAGGGEGNFAF
jgi:hypothetical protein